MMEIDVMLPRGRARWLWTNMSIDTILRFESLWFRRGLPAMVLERLNEPDD